MPTESTKKQRKKVNTWQIIARERNLENGKPEWHSGTVGFVPCPSIQMDAEQFPEGTIIIVIDGK